MPTPTNLIAWGDDTNTTSYASPSSITPGADKLIELSVMGRAGGALGEANLTSVTGCGLTWVLVGSVAFDSIASPLRRIWKYRAMGSSPSTGAVTITFDVPMVGLIASIEEWADVPTTGTNGSDAILQVSPAPTNASDSATSLAVTMASFSNASNAVSAAFAITSGSGNPLSPGTGLTQLAQDHMASSPFGSLMTVWRSGEDLSVDATVPSARPFAGISVEIVHQVAGLGSITDLAATPGDGQVQLDWTPPSGATQQKVYESVTPGIPEDGSGFVAATLTGTDDQEILSGRNNGTTYYYKISATDGSTTTWSNEVSATPSGFTQIPSGESDGSSSDVVNEIIVNLVGSNTAAGTSGDSGTLTQTSAGPNAECVGTAAGTSEDSGDITAYYAIDGESAGTSLDRLATGAASSGGLRVGISIGISI